MDSKSKQTNNSYEQTKAVWVDAETIRRMFTPPVSLKTIRNWTKRGIIPSIKLGNPLAERGGGRVYYDIAAVKAAIAKWAMKGRS